MVLPLPNDPSPIPQSPSFASTPHFVMLRTCFFLLMTAAAFAADSLKQATPWASGAGISDRIADRPADWPLLTSQFGMVTPENCMKPAATQPAPGQWRLETPDRFVEFARAKDLKVVGHCLVWAKEIGRAHV